MRIAIGAGHSPNCDGATGHGYSENAEARKICDAFQRICATNGVTCIRCDSHAYTQSAYLNEQVAIFNTAGCDVSLQIHLNSGGGTGSEVWYKTASRDLAAKMSAAMAGVLGLRDRGPKYTENLRILNSVYAAYRPYIVEVCFIDGYSDITALQGKHEKIAAALFAAVTGTTYDTEDDMQLSDKLNDEKLPDGSNNNVANVLDRTRRNSDKTVNKLNEIEQKIQNIEAPEAVVDYDKLADKIIDRLVARLSE